MWAYMRHGTRPMTWVTEWSRSLALKASANRSWTQHAASRTADQIVDRRQPTYLRALATR